MTRRPVVFHSAFHTLHAVDRITVWQALLLAFVARHETILVAAAAAEDERLALAFFHVEVPAWESSKT
jgi:hypothetical protein